MHQENYNMTVESWREQRSYLTNSISVLEHSGETKYTSFAKELRSALKAIEPKAPDTSGFKAAANISTPQTCGAVTISFGADGAIASVQKGNARWSGSLGGFQYQTLSAGNFTAFDADYGNAGCKATTENPGCHNFHVSIALYSSYPR